jgi:hypothetical protein
MINFNCNRNGKGKSKRKDCPHVFEVEDKATAQRIPCRQCGQIMWVLNEPVNRETLKLNHAIDAVKNYNSGSYNGISNTKLDGLARAAFADGLAPTLDGIEKQVRFIGQPAKSGTPGYGGFAGFGKARELVPSVAQDICAAKTYGECAKAAHPLCSVTSSVATIAYLLKPFEKPLCGKLVWLTWASKFWHFLNPEAFPIRDTRVATFFDLKGDRSAGNYVEFLERFKEYTVDDQEHYRWVESLREADKEHRCADDEVHAWCDNKLWDKVFFEIGNLVAEPLP